ncbi:conserved hypothetical protein [Culex quinquefasciatus]|uniref:CRAL-TRIO domain-containing protein n=1 Tax=Culex quinquefasciatus TaxID=7176 RepID=B0X427_CULQU|nr:conserved hypothetical protein [Culex quinquefasciatus]|eukprot:XP_001864399.1 conserved hypothetical protein [Culex quinquefasciatus]
MPTFGLESKKNNPLEELYAKIARDDLQETDENRKQSLAQMREWIAKHPLIRKCRTDSVFLLRFLRMRKFSVPRAQETLERYLAMRQTFPQWFAKLDPDQKDMKQLLDDHMFQFWGRDSRGRTVIMARHKNFNLDRFNSVQMARNVFLFLETLADDEETQIGGYVVVLDYADISMQLLALWSLTEVRNAIECVNKSLPMRIKEVHVAGFPKLAVMIGDLAISCLSQKLKERLFCHKSMEDAAKHLEVSMLTTDYPGGTQDPEELKRKFIKRAQDKRQELLLLDEMEIDATRYKSLWHQTTDGSIESGVAGSFKKLNVD